MASNREKIRLVLEETGEFYTTTINARKMATEGKGKLELKKYSKKLKKAYGLQTKENQISAFDHALVRAHILCNASQLS